MRLVARNWKSFQHYSDRRPSWIKLHKSLLDDFEFQCLPVASRALAPMLWLLASESEDGSFDGTPKKLAFRLRMTEREVADALKPLIDGGFFVADQAASDLLAEPERNSSLEKRREEERAPLATRFALSALPPDWAEFCRKERPDLNPERVFATFADHWNAKAGKEGKKLDWLATWRNWVRNERAERPALRVAVPSPVRPGAI